MVWGVVTGVLGLVGLCDSDRWSEGMLDGVKGCDGVLGLVGLCDSDRWCEGLLDGVEGCDGGVDIGGFV